MGKRLVQRQEQSHSGICLHRVYDFDEEVESLPSASREHKRNDNQESDNQRRGLDSGHTYHKRHGACNQVSERSVGYLQLLYGGKNGGGEDAGVLSRSGRKRKKRQRASRI